MRRRALFPEYESSAVAKLIGTLRGRTSGG